MREIRTELTVAFQQFAIDWLREARGVTLCGSLQPFDSGVANKKAPSSRRGFLSYSSDRRGIQNFNTPTL